MIFLKYFLYEKRLVMNKYGSNIRKLRIDDYISDILKNIAKQLNVRWKTTDNWDIKRSEYLKSHATFHNDLYKFGRNLLENHMVVIWDL